MSAYVIFKNKSHFPIISIYNSDRLINDELLYNNSTKPYRIESGSVDFTFKYNEKPFLSLWLSLYPDYSYELTVSKSSYILKQLT